MTKTLIVNADDFGASPLVNRGVIHAHECGVVTSTSLMVRQPEAAAAVAVSREYPRLGVGLHLDLGEWILRDGVWETLYEVVPTNDPSAVYEEVRFQLDAFRRLTGRDPSHIDSHQHVHLNEPVLSIVEEQASKLEVPLRQRRQEIQYCGDFYGQDEEGSSRSELITVDALLRILEGLPEGITELCCHPAEGEDLDSMYVAERRLELKVLCDPLIREALVEMGIQLSSFEELVKGKNGFSR